MTSEANDVAAEGSELVGAAVEIAMRRRGLTLQEAHARLVHNAGELAMEPEQLALLIVAAEAHRS
jgi:hypothetical protein